MLAAGANVIITSAGIDDMAQKYLVEAGVMGIRRVEYEDLKRIAKVTGATILSTMADMEGNESFDITSLGFADEVSEDRIGDNNYIFIKGTKERKCGSIVVRGPNL